MSFQKTPFFFFLHALETKIRHTLRNLLRPCGPCLYHLPPRNRSPCTPPPPPLPPPSQPFPHSTPPPSTRPAPVGTPPPPQQGILKKKPFFFFLYALETTQALAPPRPPSQPFPEPRGAANPSPNPPPSLELPSPLPPPTPPVHQASSGGYPPHSAGHPSSHAIFLLFVRVRNNKNTTHIAKFAPSLRSPCLPLESRPLVYPPFTRPALVGTPPPPHRASFKNSHFSSFLGLCSIMGPVSLPPTSGTEALAPPPRALAPPP